MNHAGEWTPAARAYVEARQERHYLKLADEMGLNGSARAAYERIAQPEITWEVARRDNASLPPQEWLSNTKAIKEKFEFYRTAAPTIYEEPNFQMIMQVHFRGLQEALRATGNPINPAPLLASLASGTVNALIFEEPKTKVSVIFFERGLFRFLHAFGHLIGWAIPILSPRQMMNDRELARVSRRHAMPIQTASRLFRTALFDYVVQGTPALVVPAPEHNLDACIMLLNYMETFVMAHELSHLTQGHLRSPYRDKNGAWDQEFEADASALSMMNTFSSTLHHSWAFSFWACDLTLTALHFLDAALSVLAYGNLDARWISSTHPDALSRRNRLRGVLGASKPGMALLSDTRLWDHFRMALSRLWEDRRSASRVSRPEISFWGFRAARILCDLTDAVFGELWSDTVPLLLAAYREGVHPSPLWRDRITHTLSPA